jgi:hypothetical protein
MHPVGSAVVNEKQTMLSPALRQRGSMEYTEQYGARACLLVIVEEYRKERNYL